MRDEDIVIDPRFCGPDYGLPDEATIAAIRTAGRLEGMLTDPVYEGKSMAGLIAIKMQGGMLLVQDPREAFYPEMPRSAVRYIRPDAVASAADNVIVIMKSVAANPSRTSTNNLPFQKLSSRSSIAIEPSPCGLSTATRR